MLKKQLIVTVFAIFFLLGSFGTALAVIESEAGEANAPETKAEVAAKNSVYIVEQVALYDSEGSYEVEYEIVSTSKALLAAANHDYVEDHLAGVGLEQEEDSQPRADGHGSGMKGVIADKRDATCSSC